MKIILNEQIAFKKAETNVDYQIWDQLNTIIHGHTFFEIFIVTKGVLHHTLNGKEERLTAGDIRLITPDDVHSQINDSIDTAVTVNLSFNRLFLKECGFLYKNTDDILRSKNCIRLQHLDSQELNYMIHIANSITKSVDIDEETRLTKTLILLLLNSFITSHSDIIDRKSPKWLTTLLKLLNDPQYFATPISEVCSMVNYSPSAMSALFKKETNQTIVGYVTNVKINYACNLLRNTNYSISTITSLLGYDSISHFDHIFKKKIGMTPNQYKKKNAVETAVLNR